eukprot:TRINITY_DN3136_c0_g1_i1.p1 TRINITY_DN3136_c0_g1~~TRINITY_DN3136_c0_g1_i1.p1  ORF type:complete len:332 (-),score=77.90 TRINITY_DN3136_c0_g1_i1:156-1151(-)
MTSKAAEPSPTINGNTSDAINVPQEASLKEQGNAFFKTGNYLKAAAIYTQAIKADPSNATLYSNRSAAFLNLVKLTKALADAETTIKLNPSWEKGYFRKGCVLEAMERYDEAVAAFRDALQQNPQNTEVATKIKRLLLLARDKKRAQEREALRSNVNMAKTLESLKSELAKKLGFEETAEEFFTFITETMETAVKTWHADGHVDARVTFLVDTTKQHSDTASIVNVEKAFESPDTLNSCVAFLRQHAVQTSSKAACLVVPKRIISFPQVWKGQGSRKWRHSQGDGLFCQFESSAVRKLWFIPSSMEKGKTLCRDPEALDLDAHAVLPPLFR